MTARLLARLAESSPDEHGELLTFLGSGPEPSPSQLVRRVLAFVEANTDGDDTDLSGDTLALFARHAAANAELTDLEGWLDRLGWDARHELMIAVGDLVEERPALRGLGPGVIDRLFSASNAVVLAEMLRFLGGCGDPAAIEPVRGLLSATEDALVRAFAVHALDELGASSDVLWAAREDDDSRVAVAGVQALVRRGELSWRELLFFAESDDHITAIQAFRGIEDFTPAGEREAAIEAIDTCLADDAPVSVRDGVLQAKEALRGADRERA